MKTRIAYSSDKRIDTAVVDLGAQLGNSARVIIYFASIAYDQADLAHQMKSEFPDCQILGCSTAGELYSDKMLKESVVAIALDDDIIEDINIQVVNDLKSAMDVSDAVKGFEKHFGISCLDMDTAKYVGIVLIDGVSRSEEVLMDKLGNLTNITFIGGSAGDDQRFEATYVHCNGKVYENAAVLALLKVRNGFDIIKTQSFRSIGQRLIATEVNEASREVVEFNGMPALRAYAQALGVSEDEAVTRFMRNPVGLMDGNEPFVRSPQKTKGQTMVFYCNIKKGMSLELLESTDIVTDTESAVKAKTSGDRTVSAIINYDCVLRTLQLEREGKCDEYGRIFSSIPTIGFSTYGEEYIGHINQTSTMLLLM